MDIRNGFLETIGNTPLIRLARASEETGCEILGKAEFLNPGSSVKDRAALYIVRDAEERGVLEPGGVIVEGTAGNTGIGLALVGNAKGYRTVIVIPETQSQEKKDMLRLCGAEVREVPAVPYKDPNNYVKLSGRLAEELAKSEPHGAIWANQFDNTANRHGHYLTTGPEIWRDTNGEITHFVSAMGTTGTIMGTSRFLKERNPEIRIVGVQPAEGAKIPGIRRWPEAYLPRIFDPARVDMEMDVTQEAAETTARRLAAEEGIFCGISSGGAVAAALRLAGGRREALIVTIICDRGDRYLSTGIFS